MISLYTLCIFCLDNLNKFWNKQFIDFPSFNFLFTIKIVQLVLFIQAQLMKEVYRPLLLDSMVLFLI